MNPFYQALVAAAPKNADGRTEHLGMGRDEAGETARRAVHSMEGDGPRDLTGIAAVEGRPSTAVDVHVHEAGDQESLG
jgi:hypothetical protein